MLAALATPVAALVVAGWPDLNTLSVRLVIATAILFGFLTAVLAQLLKQRPSGQNLSTQFGAEIPTSWPAGQS
jgi:hypothetical protein